MNIENKISATIERGRKQRQDVMDALAGVLQLAGVPVKKMEVVRTEYDTLVEVTFPWGMRKANITFDSIPTAVWDVLKQIPELRGG
jgi:hypothetical protein